MTNDGIQIREQSDSIASQETGSINTSPRSENFTVLSGVNHNEVIIMENDLNRIKQDVKLIKLDEKLDINSLLYGSLITCGIDVISKIFMTKKFESTYLIPVFAWLLTFFVVTILKKKVKFFEENNIEANKIHLNDLKRTLEEVDRKVQHNS